MTSSQFKIVNIIISLLFFLTLGFAFGYTSSSEPTSTNANKDNTPILFEEYMDIDAFSARHGDLINPSIQKALSDDIITRGEYRAISELADRLYVQDQVAKLKQKTSE